MKNILVAALLTLLSACASMAPSPAVDNYLAKDFSPPSRGSLVVLLPVPKSTEFSRGEAMMTEQLHRQLVIAGYKVAILNAANYEKVWGQEVATVGGVYDPVTGALRREAHARAMSSLAKHICDEHKCALVIRQRLVARKASLDGEYAQWDGQQRYISVVQGGVGRRYSFSGSTHGISVELFAIAADGSLALHTFGGASLLYQMNLHETRNEIRSDLFSNDKEIADGVRLALEPLRAQ